MCDICNYLEYIYSIYLSLKMEKFVVFGKYCEDAIIKRGPFREQHLNLSLIHI